MAKDIFARIPIGAPLETGKKNQVKCEYKKVELENEYLIWNVQFLHNESKPRLYGWLGYEMQWIYSVNSCQRYQFNLAWIIV